MPELTHNVAKIRQSPTFLIAAALLAFGLTGCQASPTLQQRAKARQASIDWTLTCAVEREAAGPKKLAYTGEQIAADYERHNQRLAADGVAIDRALKHDVKRWSDRQPLYLDTAGRFLWGDPEDIERVSIRLFY